MEFTFSGELVATAESYTAALTHLKEYHPRMYERVIAGEIAVAVSDPTEQARIDAERDDKRLQNAMLRGIAVVLADYENRILALEKKAPVTIDQFNATVKAKLGL